jgi:purine nucleosidase/pyrimidine-specific ribonucleoside hydrolase
VHIDTDPGLDDLLALAFAFGCPELSVEGLTTVAGNAALPVVTKNARRFCALAERGQLPLGVGANAPLALTPIDATHFHGKDGRRGIALPPVDESSSPSARDVLKRSLVEREVSAVIALGPLTNIATLAAENAALFARAEVIWMGGALGPGNVTPKAEFNAYADPRALKLVLASGVRLRVVGLDATRTVAVGEAELARAGIESGPRAEFLAAAVRALCGAERELSGEATALLHDPCAVAAAFEPGLFGFAPRALEVSEREGGERGRLRERPGATPNAEYADTAESEKLARLFVERISRWAAAP